MESFGCKSLRQQTILLRQSSGSVCSGRCLEIMQHFQLGSKTLFKSALKSALKSPPPPKKISAPIQNNIKIATHQI
jgi:hypothetical protein